MQSVTAVHLSLLIHFLQSNQVPASMYVRLSCKCHITDVLCFCCSLTVMVTGLLKHMHCSVYYWICVNDFLNRKSLNSYRKKKKWRWDGRGLLLATMTMTVFLHSVKVTVVCSQMLDVNAGITFDTSGCGLPPSGLGVWEQVLQDAELARRLQEEEDMLPHGEVCYIQSLEACYSTRVCLRTRMGVSFSISLVFRRVWDQYYLTTLVVFIILSFCSAVSSERWIRGGFHCGPSSPRWGRNIIWITRLIN